MQERHNRESVDKVATHNENQQAHQPGPTSGVVVKTVQWDTDRPDELGTLLVKVLYIHADFAPNGITLITVKIETTGDSDYEVTYQIRDAPTDASPDEIAVIATSSSEEAETSSLTNTSVDAGQYIYAVLPATDVPKAGGEITFTID